MFCVSSVLFSFIALAASSAAFLAASACAMSSNSFFDFRPRCFGMAARIISGVISSAIGSFCAVCSAVVSASSALAVLFFFISKFSPSLPFTV